MTENVIPGFPPPIGNPPLVPQLKTDGWIASFGGKVVF
jgi:hypothetical protein